MTPRRGSWLPADTLQENCCVDLQPFVNCVPGTILLKDTDNRNVWWRVAQKVPLMSPSVVTAMLLGNAALASGIFTPKKPGSPSSCWVRGEQLQWTQKSLKQSKDMSLDLTINHLLLCWCLSWRVCHAHDAVNTSILLLSWGPGSAALPFPASGSLELLLHLVSLLI